MEENRNSLGRWIALLHRYKHAYIGRELKDYNIGKGQYIFLNALYKQEGISQEQLSDYLKIDKGTTAKAIKKLEEEEYVIRKIDEKDKRAYNLYLTEKAIRIKPAVRKAMKDWRDILYSGFTEEEKELALSLVERMGKNAEAFTEEYFKEY